MTQRGRLQLQWYPSADNARLTLPSAPVDQLLLPQICGPDSEKQRVHIDWPEHVQQLVLEAECEFFLVSGLLQPSLQQLRIADEDSYLGRLDDCRFPPALTHLDLGFKFDEPISAAVQWPPALTRLELGFEFSQPLDEWQPPASLTELAFRSVWNQPTLRCPPNLRLLELGYQFNQPLDGLQLPTSLTHLKLGGEFNQSLRPLSALPHLHRLELGHTSWSRLFSGDDWSLAALCELSLCVSMPPGLSPAMLRSLPPSVTRLELDLLTGFNYPHRASIKRMLRSHELQRCVSERTLPALLYQAEEGAANASATPSLLPLPLGLRRLTLRADGRNFEFFLSA